jgi:hypothetical protein
MTHLLVLTAGTAPTFSSSGFSSLINDFASGLLHGVILILGVVLVAAVPFVLVKMAVKYMKRWFGVSSLHGEGPYNQGSRKATAEERESFRSHYGTNSDGDGYFMG